MVGDSAIWIEKYRPGSFDEVRGHKFIVSKLRAFVKKRNIPHVLFAGPAGVGKSTLALVVARELFGDSWRENFLELNASDERGIDVVRVKVKDFARTKALGDVPFKIIFLDECDALTRDAQQALRRTMERFSSSCRFILAANYSSKIVDPIQSRCAVFRFQPLPREDVLKVVDDVARKEGLSVSDKAKEALVVVAEGDLRRLTNVLQSASAVGKDVAPELIYSLAALAEPKEVRDVLELALKGDFLKARAKMLDVMVRYGLSGVDMVKQVQQEVWNLDLGGRSKVALIDKCGEIEFRLVEGSDEFVQLEALLAQFALVR